MTVDYSTWTVAELVAQRDLCRAQARDLVARYEPPAVTRVNQAARDGLIATARDITAHLAERDRT